MFKLRSSYKPTGDQPEAIKKLVDGVLNKKPYQVLLGVTGSGKTFTLSNVIEKVQKPTLVISHNKTLAAQLYQEFRDFFPDNAVEYFVSYYDYYQPESYIPQTDTYIEKDADINEEIDKLRLSSTNSLITRKDVIVVASVSCIYNLGSPIEYLKMSIELKKGMKLRMADLLKRLSNLYYTRNDFEFKRGTFRIRGSALDVFTPYQELGVRLEITNDILFSISYFNPVSGDSIHPSLLSEKRHKSPVKALSQDEKDYTLERAREGDFVIIFPAKHYIAPEERRERALKEIEADLKIRHAELKAVGKELEAFRLSQRTNYDLEMLGEIGYCKGIENYSAYFDGRKKGESPGTLIDFFPKDFLTIIDESHITVPQIRGMYNGDFSRKSVLIEHGFRLPSALENRPLRFEEFLRKTPQTIFSSATPNSWEISMSGGEVTEQVVRPTGLVDPLVTVLPTRGQVKDLIDRISERVKRGERTLVTTLTKKMAEELSSYLVENGVKTSYLHSDIETLERTDILDNLRRGEYDVLVGINLLREGLDLPEVSLVAILDADKEGFLRSETSLIQTMGRAARHLNGDVVMYADKITDSMKRAMGEVDRRRTVQVAYNKKHGITPLGITKPIRERLIELIPEDESDKSHRLKLSEDVDYAYMPPVVLKKEIKKMELEMKYQAELLNFEEAAKLRDFIRKLRVYL